MEKRTILIAEDEEINRAILVEMLKEKYDILEAADGNTAVEYISEKNDEIALVILDMHMPGLSGYDVLDFMGSKNLIDKIPVMITTSDQSEEVFDKAKTNMVADIVYKPFRANDIKRRVDFLIKTKK